MIRHLQSPVSRRYQFMKKCNGRIKRSKSTHKEKFHDNWRDDAMELSIVFGRALSAFGLYHVIKEYGGKIKPFLLVVDFCRFPWIHSNPPLFRSGIVWM